MFEGGCEDGRSAMILNNVEAPNSRVVVQEVRNVMPEALISAVCIRMSLLHVREPDESQRLHKTTSVATCTLTIEMNPGMLRYSL